MLYHTVITAYEAHRIVDRKLPEKSTIFIHPNGHVLACYLVSSNGEAEFFDQKSIKKKPFHVFYKPERDEQKKIDVLFTRD